MEFNKTINKLLSSDKYLARSDYKQLVEDFSELNGFFSNQQTAKTLDYYCSINGIDYTDVEYFLQKYADLSNLIDGSEYVRRHNQSFLERHLRSERNYLDNILKSVDPTISLDEEQRKVVLSDEDYTLVIAGAGAGKTTTVAAKVRYLVEKKHIDPEQILLISFTNKAVGELRDKINRSMKIQCPITTFHSTGYAILRKQNPAGKSIRDGGFLYTPDFTITQGDRVAYIEHFGITQDGCNNRYNAEQLEKYKAAINDKVSLHRKHGTDLIYTFSSYNDGRPLLVHLEEELRAHGFNLEHRSSKEVFDKIVSTEENKYILKLVKLICTFIQNFKTNGYNTEKFYEWESKSNNERTKLFLDVCQQCYLEYTKHLKQQHAVDFEDMINESARILRDQQNSGMKLDFKYIIVDEYQDISRQRFDLTLELSKVCDAKIIAVGDDWQSIYAYAGSDITLFTKFRQTMGYGEELKITRTYRNAQEVIDIAGGFIQQNASQVKKALVSPKHIAKPIIIQTYTEEVDRKQYVGKGGKYFLIGETVETAIGKILADNPKSSILLLGRYGFDAFNLSRSADFLYNEKDGSVQSKRFPEVKIEFMTVHRAKGLGYDNVIIINARNELYGFPSQIQEDPVLKYVVKDDFSIEYAEERRLFYVALTRTKNRVYIVTPEQHPSAFVKELIRDYPLVTVDGQLNDQSTDQSNIKHCPICGYPLQLRYKPHIGLRLWICSNEPEICDFMTNDLRGGNMSILKCDKCQDGYLIVKEGKVEPFLGCTNYKTDRTGCDSFMTREYYEKHVEKRERL